MRQHHLHLCAKSGQAGGGAGTINQAVPEGVPTLVARLDRVLEERQVLVRRLAALAPTDDTRECLGKRLQALTTEQERLLQDLMAALPPDPG